ncbi:heterokaryon incompatibility protein-domain-containing protein [Nemania sp. NC0429]|nr:heterokaryon incompatibility protein-domain-containing protein [Nemania sp. NC0429]
MRLLVLERAVDRDSPIRCRLVVCNHDERLPYDAVSYAWGNPSKVRNIDCNGKNIRVTSNLYSALLWLRKPTEDRLLWIDALCINQDNLEERGHQVNTMSQIFSRARSTLVWLGAETRSARGVLSLLRLQGDRSAEKDLVGFNFADVSSKRYLLHTNWAPLAKLLERPWFTRLWVIQEVACAKNVYVIWGSKKFGWDLLASRIKELHHIGLLDQFSMPERAHLGALSVIEIQKARERMLQGRQQRLLPLLVATSSSSCSLPKDRVYAVMSLASDYNNGDNAPFEADYGITDAEAFTEVAKWALSNGELEFLLSCASPGSDSSLPGLPSWVPDWSNIKNQTPFMRFIDRVKFDATRSGELLGRRKGAFKILDDNTLALKGFAVDVLSEIGPLSTFRKTFVPKVPSDHRDVRQGNLEWIAECSRLVHSSSGTPPDTLANYTAMKHSFGVERQLRITMTAGLTGTGHAAPAEFTQWVADYSNWLKTNYLTSLQPYRPYDNTHFVESSDNYATPDASTPKDHTMFLPDWAYPNYVAEIESSMSMWASKRRIAATEAGRLVLVPDSASKGDFIFLVDGCRIPYVFRRHADGKSYSAVGEAFVDDLMNGEFFATLCITQEQDSLLKEFHCR